jgi:hypothetical protein
MDLTDAQWAFLEPQFRPKRRKDGRGRPWQDTRALSHQRNRASSCRLEGIID